MTFENQPIPQFLLLTALGLIAICLGLALVTDYKGMLTRYAHRLSQSYQGGWYQKTFIWTNKQREHVKDEGLIRRGVRIPSFGLILIGVIFLAGELGALATGHVT